MKTLLTEATLAEVTAGVKRSTYVSPYALRNTPVTIKQLTVNASSGTPPTLFTYNSSYANAVLTGAALTVLGTDAGTHSGIEVRGYNGGAPGFTGIQANGTLASGLTATTSGQALFRIFGQGRSSASVGAAGTSSYIGIHANENWSATNNGTYFSVNLIANGAINRTGDVVKVTTDTTTLASLATSITGIRIVSTDTLSGAGAVPIVKDTTKLTSTGASQAITLANGVDGQIKRIIHDVDGGSMVLTPTTKTGFSTVTFTNAGDSVTLEYVTTRGWIVVGSYGVTIAP